MTARQRAWPHNTECGNLTDITDMMGVAALEDWCRRGLEGYKGVKITDMSSSWRDGLAFCALIHRYRPDLLDFDRLDPQDWIGNCSLAFQVAESQLGIPTLLDVEDVIKNESPDQFFIMTYVAQFYHRFTAPDSGYDSTLTTSFKYSSSEEESPRRIDNTGKRKGGGSSMMDWKRRRPLGLVVSGGLELRIDSPPEEKENPFKSDDPRNHENTLKTYDADDEEGESSEVILRHMAEARNGTLGHHDLVLKRKRPNSLNRVSSSSMEKENYAKPKEMKTKAEKRGSKRAMKPKFQEPVSKRKMIGISDFPKPYENKDSAECDSQKYLTERRRKRSVESAAYSNLYNQTSARLRDSHDPLIERVKQVPLHIAESQKLLKTSIFQLKSPQYPTKCLILNIYKIKYDKKPTVGPPAVKYQNNSSEVLRIKQSENKVKDTNFVPEVAPTITQLGQLRIPEATPASNASPLSQKEPLQTNGYTQPQTNGKIERFKIKPQERMQSIKSKAMLENTVIQTNKYETEIQIHETPAQRLNTVAHSYENTTQNLQTSPAHKYEEQTKIYRKPKPPIKSPTASYETEVETHETSSDRLTAQTHAPKLEIDTYKPLTQIHSTKYGSQIHSSSHETQIDTSKHEKETHTSKYEKQIHASIHESQKNASIHESQKNKSIHQSKTASKHESQSAMQIDSEEKGKQSISVNSQEPRTLPHTNVPLPSKTPAPQRRTCAQNRKEESVRVAKDNYDTHETDSPRQSDFGRKSESMTPSRRSQILSQFERYNVQTPSTWKTRSVESSSECFNIEPNKQGRNSDQFKSHTLTPRSKSKYEHLIKNLTESQDDNLVIYKVMETTPSKPSTAPLPVTPYKEPKDKYTIEYLWNIGATNFHSRRPTRKCH